MKQNNELRQTVALFLQELRRYNARDQRALTALLSKPENFGKRVGARNYWILAYAECLDEMTIPAKARKIETEWERYLVSARWRIDRESVILPPETEFPIWYLHVISTLNEEKSLSYKQIVNIIK